MLSLTQCRQLSIAWLGLLEWYVHVYFTCNPVVEVNFLYNDLSTLVSDACEKSTCRQSFEIVSVLSQYSPNHSQQHSLSFSPRFASLN